MLPNRLIMAWCLGVLVVSTVDAVAKPSGIGPTKIVSAKISSFETSAASAWSSIPPPVASAIRVAQNASDRNNGLVSIPNAANISLRMSPDESVGVGTKISFRVTSRKPGYVLLIDIDANGKMSQIFPGPEMIAQSEEAAANFIKPGEELLIPNSAAKKRGFEYVITPPLGAAAVVAILSDRRVQIIDLPDSAQKPRTEAETITYLAGWTRELRVPDPRTGKLQPSNWSFDIKQYSIK